jgi:hypothetical protein
MLVTAGLVAGGCHDQETPDGGLTTFVPPNLCHASGAPPGSCYSPVPDGGQLPPTEVISGGSTPVAEAFFESMSLTNGTFPSGSWVKLRAPGRLPDTMSEMDSLGSVDIQSYFSNMNCALMGTCPSWAVTVLAPDGGTELKPGASYSVEITAREPLSCALVGSGDVCNVLHGSVHAVLVPANANASGTRFVDWSF